MPTDLKARSAPADVISNTVKVMRIAAGEEVEELPADSSKDPTAKELGAKGGRSVPGT